MRIGRVIGRTVLHPQEPSLKAGRFLVVTPLDQQALANLNRTGSPMVSSIPSVVVYDQLGAGDGDLIGFVEGAEATAPFDRPIPIDAYNAAIFDHLSYQPPKKVIP